jgi:hypothetical protein
VIRTIAVIGAIAAAVVASVLWLSASERLGPEDFHRPRLVLDKGMKSVGDVVRFQGHYVATDITANRLIIFDDLALGNLRYFDPATIGQEFHSPHFLAVSAQGTLLVSEGWGSGIVELRDLDGGGWRRFSGGDPRFKAPHGLCVDADGWIYVGDALNSRLVRFRDMTGTGWQVFADVDKRIAYIRQLRCEDGAVWAANSYEGRPGLNPGTGANILKITGFDSGRVEEVVRVPDASITGFARLPGGGMVLSLWGAHQRLAFTGRDNPKVEVIADSLLPLGIPYGIYQDPHSGSLLVAYLGSPRIKHDGGIAVFGGR